MGRQLQGVFICIGFLWASLLGGDSRPVLKNKHFPDLRQLTQNSGVIFLGRVEKIEIPLMTRPSGEPVKITFRVVDALRGTRKGEAFVVREWRGLWPPGRERYQRGETWVLFLHRPSRLGYTSPVGGDTGRIEVTPSQRLVLSPERAASLFSRSMRLRRQQSGAEALRTANNLTYAELSAAIREVIAEHR